MKLVMRGFELEKMNHI